MRVHLEFSGIVLLVCSEDRPETAEPSLVEVTVVPDGTELKKSQRREGRGSKARQAAKPVGPCLPCLYNICEGSF